MGASQSYEKAALEINLNSEIEDLEIYLNLEALNAENSEEEAKNLAESSKCNPKNSNSWCSDDKLNKYSLLKLYEEEKKGGEMSVDDKTISNNLEKIKASMDMYLLYDNYNLKNNVIIKDLKKKLQNQNAEVKTDDEQIDKLKFNINNLKENIETNKSIKLYLLIVIILALLLIIIFSVLLYLKFKV
jgi:hypothetical protein